MRYSFHLPLEGYLLSVVICCPTSEVFLGSSCCVWLCAAFPGTLIIQWNKSKNPQSSQTPAIQQSQPLPSGAALRKGVLPVACWTGLVKPSTTGSVSGVPARALGFARQEELRWALAGVTARSCLGSGRAGQGSPVAGKSLVRQRDRARHARISIASFPGSPKTRELFRTKRRCSPLGQPREGSAGARGWSPALAWAGAPAPRACRDSAAALGGCSGQRKNVTVFS